MLRMLSSLVTALLLVLGIALWHADEPTRERIGEAVTPAVERGLQLADDAARSARGEPRVAPPPERPAPPAEPAPERVEIEERRPFREAPLPAVAEGEPLAAEEAGEAAVDGVAAPVDPEEWARLIRRMLALYARVAGE